MVKNTLWTTTAAPTTTEPPRCVNGWTERDGVCHRAYKVTDKNKLNWYDANAYCQHIGGHLSSFRSLNSLQDVLRGQSIYDTGSWNYVPFWIGLNKIDSNEGWQYTDGTPVSFLNWDTGFPDTGNGVNDCVEISGNFKMVNKICYTKQGFICQLEKGLKPNSPDDFDPLPVYNSKFVILIFYF